MFRHRLTKFGVSSLVAMMMLFIGGSLQSCKDWLDDYPYDDPGDPEWLGASIYDFLKEGTANHTYSNFVAIIDSLGEKEALAHTGSKTLFVADDAAFERFFNNGNNVWGVTSVGEMTTAQMKMILYGSMLDNAMLLDMLASTGTEINDEGTCLRRWSSSRRIDSIPVVDGNMEYHQGWPTYNKYWSILRGNDRSQKMRLAMDGSRSMMVHFLYDYLRKNEIKASDIEFLFTKKGQVIKTFVDGDAFIYGNKIVSSDVDAGSFSDDTLTITCKNGYVYRLDELLLPPSNMADELRKRPDTRIFSHLLDRFCVPVYDETLTKEFNAYYKTNDSVFRLRYFTSAFPSHTLLATTNNNPQSNELLDFDPGQNDYSASSSMAGDMAAMFVPNDEVLYDYFAQEDGAGRFLLERYAPNVQVSDVASLMSALDSVPEKNIIPFLKNLMKPKFTDAVLSNFDRIVDTANELMNISGEHVDECVVANNGVIYILNSVFGPGEYQAVSAPTLVFDNMGVMRNVIEQLRYDYYLLAMDANYTFIVPDDNHFVYYDPLTFTSDKPKAYSFHFNTLKPKANGALKFWANEYIYNPVTMEINPDSKENTEKEYDIAKKGGWADKKNEFHGNRFTDLMEYLIIVHDNPDGIFSGNKYYMTKGYGTIKVDVSDPNNIKIYGGEQLERGTSVVVSSKNTQKNGTTYSTVPGQESDSTHLYSAIPTPPTRSVYENMKMKANSEFEDFYEFYNLCYPGENYASTSDDGLLKKVFNIGKNGEALLDSAERYSIFFTNAQDRSAYTKNTVPFFNIYHYTVYVPTNDAIKAMYHRGLPTWAQVDSVATHGNKAKAASMLRSIINFAKYHFQDNSVYVDNTILGKQYTTAVINEKTNRFYELTVAPKDDTFIVIDNMRDSVEVITEGEENKDWNIMCRDNVYESNGTGPSATLKNYASSSFSVMQPINGVLLNESMFGYDTRFKRFADNGATVDTMYVDGTGYVNAADGRDYYLVATIGNIRIADVDGVQEIHKLGYLMEPITASDDEYDASLTCEKLVSERKIVEGVWQNFDIIVTDEGLRVEAVKDEKGKVLSYKYATIEKDGIIYMVKYNNDGTVKKEIPVGEAAPEEGGDNN